MRCSRRTPMVQLPRLDIEGLQIKEGVGGHEVGGRVVVVGGEVVVLDVVAAGSPVVVVGGKVVVEVVVVGGVQPSILPFSSASTGSKSIGQSPISSSNSNSVTSGSQ